MDLLKFDPIRARWDRDSDCLAFTGTGPRGDVAFLITAEALGEMLTPGGESVDGETGVELFEEFSEDIFRVAQREARRRGVEQQPIFIFREDVALE